jgi:uncharacterized protein YrrD
MVDAGAMMSYNQSSAAVLFVPPVVFETRKEIMAHIIVYIEDQGTHVRHSYCQLARVLSFSTQKIMASVPCAGRNTER